MLKTEHKFSLGLYEMQTGSLSHGASYITDVNIASKMQNSVLSAKNHGQKTSHELMCVYQ